MEINSREELVGALMAAAELEHGLLCQYVFAAVSLKQHPDEGISWPQLELVRDWKRTLLEVSRQEMAHLGTVCNLLTAVGGPPHFMRVNFPQAAIYFPEDAPFVLEAFGEPALRRFIRFEEPEINLRSALADIAPEPVDFTHVGELYRSIETGFSNLDDGRLFIGPEAAQDDNAWSRGLHLSAVHDLASVRKAISFIIEEGEGGPGSTATSHHQRFVAAQQALREQIAADPGFAPARPVAVNPLTRQHLDAENGSAITDPDTLSIAELFAVSYETMLLMLSQFYSFGPETPAQRNALRHAIREMMSVAIRPLAEILTQLPMGADNPGKTAGPGFELYGDLQNSPHVENAWFVICERLARYGQHGLALAAAAGAHPRLQFCAENLILIGNNLARAAAPGFLVSSPALARRRVTTLSAGLATDESVELTEPVRIATARYGSAARSGEDR